PEGRSEERSEGAACVVVISSAIADYPFDGYGGLSPQVCEETSGPAMPGSDQDRILRCSYSEKPA
ncbi:hypothetical protein AB4043_03295, partial [Terriglobus sp. YAF25]|uniref:hypothetical protein n=1 Tax=Terriglobus sp. YAF25 TaxID=3233080 RepID=UPI003F9870C0